MIVSNFGMPPEHAVSVAPKERARDREEPLKRPRVPPRKGDQLIEVRIRGRTLHIDELMKRDTECPGYACEAVERDRFLNRVRPRR